jgi:hypothetical protein
MLEVRVHRNKEKEEGRRRKDEQGRREKGKGRRGTAVLTPPSSLPPFYFLHPYVCPSLFANTARHERALQAVLRLA